MTTPGTVYVVGASAAGGAVLMVAYALCCGIGPIAGIPVTVVGLVNLGLAASYLRSFSMPETYNDEHSADGWAVPWQDGLGRTHWQPCAPDGVRAWYLNSILQPGCKPVLYRFRWQAARAAKTEYRRRLASKVTEVRP